MDTSVKTHKCACIHTFGDSAEDALHDTHALRLTQTMYLTLYLHTCQHSRELIAFSLITIAKESSTP